MDNNNPEPAAATVEVPGLEEALDALASLLPMAKGWAYQHNVGANMEKVEQAEATLRQARAALSTPTEGPKREWLDAAKEACRATEGGGLPVAEWQYRVWWNGDGGEPMGWGDWQKVRPRNRLSTVEDMVTELRAAIARGSRYEIRPLYYARPTAAAAAGVPPGFVLVPRKLAWDIFGLLSQECAPCAEPECRISDNPEALITQCRQALYPLLAASGAPAGAPAGVPRFNIRPNPFDGVDFLHAADGEWVRWKDVTLLSAGAPVQEPEQTQDSVHSAAPDAERALRAAPLSSLSQTDRSALPQWLPIETAPKDGTTILLGFMEDGEITQTAEMQWGHVQRNGLFPGKVGMWVCPGGNFTWNPEPAEFGPSHWMPAAPGAKGQE